MRAILDALPRHPGRKYVVNDSDAPMCVSGFTKTLLDGAGIAPWRFHDLRRTFATGSARLGATRDVIDAALNHKIPGVAGIYNKYPYEPECKAAVELWSAHVEKLVS
jgi:integrase